ncbi:MAG: hypothetical protein ACF8R9_09820 [Phycisphaerales bacterium JB054]
MTEGRKPPVQSNDLPDDQESGPIDPDKTADDRFVHGLLQFMHQDTTERCDARVERAMQQIRTAPRDAAAQRHRRRLLPRIVQLATAAMLALLTITLLIVSPPPRAYAMVDAAIEATLAAPGLRYEILAVDQGPGTRAGEPALTATEVGPAEQMGILDMRGQFMRARITTPSGDEFVMGRDAAGEWSLRRDGSVVREDARRAAPRWIDLGERTVLIGSLDKLLAELRDNFAIESTSTDTTDGRRRITATRRAAPGTPGPETVVVWIDPGSALVERLEMHWPPLGRPDAALAPRPREDGSRPDGRGPPAPPRRGHPQILEGPPGFGQGQHPAPPRAIIFQRVQTVDLTDEQFAPPSP